LEKRKTRAEKEKKAIKIELNRQGVKEVVSVFADKINKMLKEGTNESVEIGTKKVGNAKVDYGFRMKFLDNEKDEKIKYIRKKKREV
jgi:hypothetical protein